MLSQYSNLSCMNFDTTNDQEEFISKVDSVCTSLRSFEEEWILYEVMIQHKKMLVSQIDILIKERKKARKLISLRYL